MRTCISDADLLVLRISLGVAARFRLIFRTSSVAALRSTGDIWLRMDACGMLSHLASNMDPRNAYICSTHPAIVGTGFCLRELHRVLVEACLMCGACQSAATSPGELGRFLPGSVQHCWMHVCLQARRQQASPSAACLLIRDGKMDQDPSP